MMRAAILAAALLPGAAWAEGFTIYDLGVTRDRETCLYRAERALDRYSGEHGLYEIQPTEWIVFAYDLRPGDQDVVIMCPVVGGDGGRVINAFLNVHGETTPDEREFTAQEIERYWNE